MPAAAVEIEPLSTVDSIEHIVGVIALEGEAVSVCAAKILDGIAKAAGFADYRNSSVAKSYHLGKAAGFALAWHKENVGTGINFSCKRGNESADKADSAGIFFLHMAEETFKSGFAGTEDGDLNVAFHDSVANSADKIEAFMGNKAADHSDKHFVRVGFKAEFFLKFLFAFCFSGKIEFRESCGNFGVCGRVVTFNVDSVKDSGKFPGSFSKKAVHSPGEPGILNFLGIAWAYGGNGVALVNSGFHIVAASVIFNDSASVFRNSENVGGKIHIIVSLILNVVDAVNGFYSRNFFFIGEENFDESGNKAGLPIVAMDYVRGEIHVFHRFKNGHGKICETLAVVKLSVNCVAFEIIFIIDEIESYAAANGFKKSAI